MFKISEASNRWISHVFWILYATTRKLHARGHQYAAKFLKGKEIYLFQLQTWDE